jgi:DnaK suppressor protein
VQHLSAGQIESLRVRLEQERDALMRQRQQEATDAVAAAERQPDVGDRQDAAATEAAQLAQWTLADHERARLAEIEAALRRMTDGTYGVCELTDEPIPYGRLEIEPTARTTVEAQEDEERERSREKQDAGAKRRAY